MLRHIEQPNHPDLLVGTDTGDDAAVWQRPDGRALVSTADFFTPIVDDARTWGRIAAANAVSDVYAMGGEPLFALNLVAWPREHLPLDLLGEVMAGGSEIAAEGGWVVAGGHTVDGPEPMYGQSVTGEVDPNAMMTNAGGAAGDVLILTKPLGTGLLATAVKRSEPAAVAAGGWLAETYTAGVREMTRLNSAAAAIARSVGSRCGTDVTGFGLLGHLHKMVVASGVHAVIELDAVPLLPGTVALLDAGYVPGGSERNAEYVREFVDGEIAGDDLLLLADAQTSGGLLFGCSPDAAPDAVARLIDSGHTAAVVGALTSGDAGRLSLS